jgi:hypothetical protein
MKMKTSTLFSMHCAIVPPHSCTWFVFWELLGRADDVPTLLGRPEDPSTSLGRTFSANPKFSSVVVCMVNSFMASTDNSPKAEIPVMVFHNTLKLVANATWISARSASGSCGI